MTKRNQKYVFRCIKAQTKPNQFFLGNRRRYKVGDFPTYEGNPTSDINMATVNTLEEYDPRDCEEFNECFEMIPIKIVPIKHAKNQRG